MPTIPLPVALLRTALPLLSRVAGGRTTLPVLSCLLVTRDGPRVSLTADDLDVRLTYTAAIEPEPITALQRAMVAIRWAHENGSRCVSPGTLRAALKAAPRDGTITLSDAGLTYTVGGSPVTVAMDTPPVEDFPSGSALPAGAPSAPVNEMHRAALSFAGRAISTDETRYILNGALLGEGMVVASDGRRVHAAPFITGLADRIVMPAKTVDLCESLLTIEGREHREGALAIYPCASAPDSRRVRLTAGPWTLDSKTIEGNFPNWRQVLPAAEHRATLRVDAAALDRLRQVITGLPPHPKDKPGIQLRCLPDRLSVRCASTGAEIVVPGLRCDAPIGIACDRHFFLDLLVAGPGALRFGGTADPISLEADSGALAVQMPMRGVEVTVPDPEREALIEQWLGKPVCRHDRPRDESIGRITAIERDGLKIRVTFQEKGAPASSLGETVDPAQLEIVPEWKTEAPAPKPKAKAKGKKQLAAAA